MTEEQVSTRWAELAVALEPGTDVSHWSAEGQYRDESVKVVRVDPDRVWINISRPTLPTTRPQRIMSAADAYRSSKLGRNVMLPSARPQREVPKNQVHLLKREAFIRALMLWSDYCHQIISRKSFDVKVGGSSTYIISMIRWLEQKRSSAT
jgi:hypothetical protein